jgi:uncharacterized protein (TIGR03790 family)
LVPLALLAWGCGSPSTPAIGVPVAKAGKSSERVLLVANLESAESLAIAKRYAEARGIPQGRFVAIRVEPAEEIEQGPYESQIENPIRRAIEGLDPKPDFIVLTRGVPIRIAGELGYSVDAALGALDLDMAPITRAEPEQIQRCLSPYFGKEEPFSSEEYGFYLVTRLDGYSLEDCLNLIENSVKAEFVNGPFLLDANPKKKEDGYSELNLSLEFAANRLRSKGFDAVLDELEEFVGSEDPLAGYATWGSNDSKFSPSTYKSLRFLPGAVAETFVSTSGRTFKPTLGGQSLIADLIAQGVTGVKGYVSEPFTFALARPHILFDRYTSGFTLAESFAMASPILKWKDVVIGDPLCAPYAPK